ncbi:hypothetical protein AMELA_G00276540 [Ameiurus melas]|uniref:Complexin 2, like n=1 Tax=Ameiurus melas TaxID=219545 RepID=A0A7J5ZM14_AMEME|nr:hypothetical protein AMELA_G00276540 [Ameiurus melas]
MNFIMKAAMGGGPPDVGKMLGGEEDKDPEAEKEKEEERQEALRQQEEERKAKYTKMEAEREVLRQGIRDKKREEAEAEAQGAMDAASEGSLTRPKKAVPSGCGDEDEEEESIMDTMMKYLPGPLQDMLKK